MERATDSPPSSLRPEFWSRAGAPEEEAAERFSLLGLFVGVHVAEYVVRQTWLDGDPASLAATASGVLAVLGLLAVVARRRTLAYPILFASAVVSAFAEFPYTANHGALLAVTMFILSVYAPDRAAVQAVGAMRWVTGLVFAWAGVQKLAYGYYFESEFFAEYSHSKAGFAWLLERLAADDARRILHLNPADAGAGPFRSGSLSLWLLGNFAWFIELVVPALLFVRRAWIPAALAAAAFTYSIQLFAREFTFGLFFGGLMGLFLPIRWFRWQVRATVALDIVLFVLVLAGVEARWHFN